MPDSSQDFIGIASPEITEAEERAVLRVLRSGRLAQGPEVERFEQVFGELQGVPQVAAVSNGTTALQTALHVLGIKSGDEVLVPAFTFAASANAVIATGATPVFVDIADNWHIDLADAAAKVTDRTAAIMPVHLYGLMTDMQAVSAFAAEHELGIVEDAAQAHLSRRDGHAAGSVGVGAFSFYATKNAMTGEGGAVTSQDAEVIEKAKRFRNHGMTTRYTHVEWGLNLRMTELQAAIGTEQLSRLEKWTERRRAIANRFTQELPSLFTPPTEPDGAYHVYHQYTVEVPMELRDTIRSRFIDSGIGVDVYYPTPVPSQAAFEGSSAEGRYPAAERAAASILNLPVHHQITDADIDRIVSVASAIAEELA